MVSNSPPQSRNYDLSLRATSRRLPATTDCSKDAMLVRHQRLREEGHSIDQIAGTGSEIEPALLAGSIEGFVGFARIPSGWQAPCTSKARRPRATSTSRWPPAKARWSPLSSMRSMPSIAVTAPAPSAAGEQVGRAPCFEFGSLMEAGPIRRVAADSTDPLRAVVAETSRYCRLSNLNAAIVGNTVYTLFNFSTGDAAGQNMVTLAAQAAVPEDSRGYAGCA